jgi:hypothetical protein
MPRLTAFRFVPTGFKSISPTGCPKSIVDFEKELAAATAKS